MRDKRVMQQQRRDRNYYYSLRQHFVPNVTKLVIIAESPPVSGKYFYDPNGKTTEPLFSAFTRHLGLAMSGKEQGLRELQRLGWILMDATCEPVNKLESEAAREQVIARDYGLLLRDLATVADKTTPIVLIKKTVCRVLEPRLLAAGYNVINRGRVVYFPAHSRQGQFAEQFSAVLREGLEEPFKPRAASPGVQPG
jgi:hypothetical protein